MSRLSSTLPQLEMLVIAGITIIVCSTGGFKDVGVLITQGGDIIFKLSLPAIINVPVNILMVFTDANKEAKEDRDSSNLVKQSNRSTTTSFNNTDAITHIIFSSKVPFNVFTVGVALVSGPVEGPVQNNSKIYGEFSS